MIIPKVASSLDRPPQARDRITIVARKKMRTPSIPFEHWARRALGRYADGGLDPRQRLERAAGIDELGPEMSMSESQRRVQFDRPGKGGQSRLMSSACAVNEAVGIMGRGKIGNQIERSGHRRLACRQFGSAGSVPAVQIITHQGLGEQAPRLRQFTRLQAGGIRSACRTASRISSEFSGVRNCRCSDRARNISAAEGRSTLLAISVSPPDWPIREPSGLYPERFSPSEVLPQAGLRSVSPMVDDLGMRRSTHDFAICSNQSPISLRAALACSLAIARLSPSSPNSG